MKEFTTEEILELMDRFSRDKLTSFELNSGSFSLKMGREQTVVQAAPAAPAVSSPTVLLPETGEATGAAPAITGQVVTSPIVGTFYSAPAPDKAPFVRVGQRVSKGDVLFIVESMKLMNEVTSDYEGTVSRILVENGQPVEFGTPVMEIE